MACACKVGRHIDKINKQYGIENSVIKTDIRGNMITFLKKIFVVIICLPFFPLALIFLAIRKIITDKPISITRFIKIHKNVRH